MVASETSETDDEARDTGKGIKGEVKEVLGAVTGDRSVEAEGRLEQKVADPEAPEADESQGAVRQQEQAVRRDHHDLPGARPDEAGPLGT